MTDRYIEKIEGQLDELKRETKNVYEQLMEMQNKWMEVSLENNSLRQANEDLLQTIINLQDEFTRWTNVLADWSNDEYISFDATSRLSQKLWSKKEND